MHYPEPITMFSDPTIAIVNIVMIVGILVALVGARFVGKQNKDLHAKNVAARAK